MRAGAQDEDLSLPARALGCLFLAGATIGVVSVLLPLPDRAHIGGLYSNIGLAYGGGAVLILGSGHLRRWMLHAALASGAVLIMRAILLSGEADSFYSVWFIWVGLYAFSFFSRPAAVGHLAIVAALYGITLLHDPPTSPVARWLTTVSTLVVAGFFIGVLVRRIRQQASAAAMTASRMVEVAELAHRLASIPDGAAARSALTEGGLRATRADRCTLWEPARDGISLNVTATATATAGVAPVERALVKDRSDHLLVAFATARPQTVPPQGRGGSAAGRRGAADVSRLCQPVMHETQVVAVLELAWQDAVLASSAETLAIARLMAAEAAATLQRVDLLATLQTLARTDELTGLPNRRAWHERVPVEIAHASRTGESLTVAMLDLDHFKDYNDTRGHQNGDRLLKQVASYWSNRLREIDLLVRYGGEEFALLLPNCRLENATEIVEVLRITVPDGQSCSAGVATWNGRETAEELLDRADRALYDAKRAGRNRSAIAGQPHAVRT